MSCGCIKSLTSMLRGKGSQQPSAQPAQPGAPAPAQPAKPAPANGAPAASAPDNTSNNNNTAQPAIPQAPDMSTTPATTQIDLVNQSNGSQQVYAFITGQALNNGNKVVLIQADGRTPYFPNNPSSTGASLGANCAIPLGGVGATTTCIIPQIAGGRIWFSYGTPIQFLLNPGPNGPALVEPSVTNPSDPSINIPWGFAEFTYNSQQLFVNISYVDFVSLPIALDLYETTGANQHVSGLPQNGLTTVVNGLNAQQAADGAGWNKLIRNGPNGQPLRVLSPNAASVGASGVAANYWDGYVNQIWGQYTNQNLQIDTQAAAGTVSGRVQNGVLTFPDGSSFNKPTGADIFSCSTGPFSTAGVSLTALGIIPRLAAAFNRTTLQFGKVEPSGVNSSQYYTQNPTNHYSRILHNANVDRKGYAFPYDDVVPSGGSDVAGTVFSGTPQRLVVTVGGGNAH